LEHLAPRVRAGFPLIDFPISQQPADVRVIVADLFDPAFPRRQIVNPAVADMPEYIQPGVNQQRLNVASIPEHSS